MDRALQVGQKLPLHVANRVWKEIRCYDNFLFYDLDKPPPDGQAYDRSSGPPKGWLGFLVFFYTQQPKTENDLIAKTRKERQAPDQQRHHAEELIGHGGA